MLGKICPQYFHKEREQLSEKLVIPIQQSRPVEKKVSEA